MFIHNFKNTIKILFRNRMLIFWTYAFPIILGVFFFMAFSNIEKSEQLDIIDIAIVDNDEFQNDLVLKKTFEELSNSKSEDQMFDTRYVDEGKAKKLLENEEIDGYLVKKDGKMTVVVAESGINETILKNVTDEILQTEKMLYAMMKNSRNESSEMNAKSMQAAMLTATNIKDVSSDRLSYTMIEFYTLIAMACLYGGMIGMTAMNQNLPNMTQMGKRVSVSPISKAKLVLGSVAAGYVVQLIGLFLLFVFTVFVLKVDYGRNFPMILLLAFAGSFAGLSLGIAIGSLLKTGENGKIGVMIAVTMAGCFLSGMMGITMKYLVDTYIPVLNKINPAGMITDGFYALYYYDTYDRDFFDVISLLVFSVCMIGLAMTDLRRQTYDSI